MQFFYFVKVSTSSDLLSNRRWKSTKPKEAVVENISSSEKLNQPETPTKPGSPSNSPYMDVIGDRFTVFHKPSDRVIEVPLIQRDKVSMHDVSLHFRKSERIWHLSQRQTDLYVVEDDAVKDKADHQMKSIEEASWYPSTVQLTELPGIYGKLSKLRLTGMYMISLKKHT